MRAHLVCLALVAAGCGGSYTNKDIELSLVVDDSVTDADLASVHTLDVAVTGDASATMTYTLGRPMARLEHLLVHFAAARGHVTVSVLARDGQSLVAMRGNSGDVDLELSGAHKAVATLRGLPSGMHQPSAIELLPAHFTLFTGQAVQLGTTGEMVTWSAADGGTVDDSGLYTAPATPGTYHVTAKSALYPTDQGTVTLDVLQSGIARYVGDAGGEGTVDGTGAAARVNQPQGIALDGNTVYFTDTGLAVRKLDLTTGAVTTIAGRVDQWQTVAGAGSNAGFSGISNLVYDGNGTVYVAEPFCPCIRAVGVATGQTTIVAGQLGMSGTMDGVGTAAQLHFPQGLAYDATKKLIYFSENESNTIRTFDPATGKVTTIAGVAGTAGAADGAAATATFADPWHLVLDGNALFVWDVDNHRIRKLDLGAMTVSTVAKDIDTTAITSAGPGQLALGTPLRTVDEQSGTVTAVNDMNGQPMNDYFNAFVRAPDGSYLAGAIVQLERFDPASKTRTFLAGWNGDWAETDGRRAAARIDSFAAFTVRASDGSIYGHDNRIFRIDPTGNLTTIAMNANIQSNGGMTFGADGMMYVADSYRQVIFRVDVDHGGKITTFAGQLGKAGYADGPALAAQFNDPEGLAVDGNTLYVADEGNRVIRAVDLTTGTVSTFAGAAGMCGNVDMPGTQARFCGPSDVLADGNGNLYVADFDNQTIRKIVLAGAGVSTVAGTQGMNGFADGTGATVRFFGPRRLALDKSRAYLYVAELDNDDIRRVDLATGAVTTVAGGPGKAQVVEGALPGAINQPGSIALAPTGELLVAVPRENAIEQIRLP